MSLIPLFTPVVALERRYTVSANAENINAFTLFGSPATAGRFRLIIAAGVVVSATSTATAALVTGAFPSGSVLIIENRGTIKGKGGTGGAQTIVAGNSGGAGGPAISLSLNVSIDNASGSIWGGGGGGGSGAPGSSGESYSYGGAGGNGAGPDAATAGSGSTIQSGDFGSPPSGGNGGAGGDYGTAGSSGGSASGYIGYNPGSGGAAGKAVNLNGYAVTWIAGNNSTQVKGAVS